MACSTSKYFKTCELEKSQITTRSEEKLATTQHVTRGYSDSIMMKLGRHQSIRFIKISHFHTTTILKGVPFESL